MLIARRGGGKSEKYAEAEADAPADDATSRGRDGGQDWTHGDMSTDGISADAVPLDERTRATLASLPALTVNAGPRDGPAWNARLKEELAAVIAYVKLNKSRDSDWFTISSDPTGVVWRGRCWTFYKSLRYEVAFEFTIGVGYPVAPLEILVPELEGLTVKMYRGGRICCDTHFAPLWQRSAPRMGIAHALALGLGPWLAVEIPVLADAGAIAPR